ncbi:LysM peptidoglycan-binding domain-containing protein [Xylanibacillus composti]|uniref:LysM domain-containing protein n=1 Tax=Xylanibacillus composti TaxID=1572762 RepID=A0A8J4H0S7_9BACL|nr:LysM peptidoglycan-binding domain-containing protein [Xylanibacillus composti]MDT9726037.1 LysM peptidoglycan-binding domain-containing protein [Xylanibacillus composti]GIQ68818.1 hypothetical protein XYCOK13_16420 [Xylanibacillus composti]
MPIVEGNHFIYTVQPGDSLYAIAAKLGSAIQLLEQTNALYPPLTDPGLIYPGQVLVVSEAGLDQRAQVNHIVAPGDTLSQIANRYATTPELLAGINQRVYNPDLIFVNQALLVPAAIYEIAEGESLNGIARRLGLPLAAIIRANQGRPGFSPDVIYAGYRLILPLPSSPNAVVFSPQPGELVRPGLAIEGFVRAPGGTAYYRIVDDAGELVTRERTFRTLEAAPAFSYFSTIIQFDRQPTTSGGELWVYPRSPGTGIQDIVQVKIRFSD